MNGIHAAFTGRIGKDAEVRTASRWQALGILPCGLYLDGCVLEPPERPRRCSPRCCRPPDSGS